MASIYTLVQLLISLYTLYSGVAFNDEYSWLFMGIILCHLIIYLMNVIVNSRKVHNGLYSIDCLFLLGAFMGVSSQFGILFIMQCIELGLYKSKKWPFMAGLLVIIGYEVMRGDLLREQLIFYLLIGLLMSSVHYYEKEVRKIKGANEEVREELYALQQKLIAVELQAGHIKEVTKMQERNRLVQKLHDKLGHVLVANIMQLEAVKLVWPTDQETGEKLLENSISNLRIGMEDIRITLRNIKPEQVELGLSQIRKLLEDLKQSQRVETSLEMVGDMSAIGPDIWYVIQQNLQEAITNLMKYSNADYFKVRLEVLNQIIRIQFKDNGKVIASYRKGMGLIGMEERLQAIQGRLLINAEEGFELIMIIERMERDETSYSG